MRSAACADFAVLINVTHMTSISLVAIYNIACRLLVNYATKVKGGTSVIYEFGLLSWKIAGAKGGAQSPTVHLLFNFD